MYKVINWDTNEVLSEHTDFKEAKKACRAFGAIPAYEWENKYHKTLSPIAFVGDVIGMCVYNPRFRNPDYTGE
jgi:hypothetical protein